MEKAAAKQNPIVPVHEPQTVEDLLKSIMIGKLKITGFQMKDSQIDSSIARIKSYINREIDAFATSDPSKKPHLQRVNLQIKATRSSLRLSEKYQNMSSKASRAQAISTQTDTIECDPELEIFNHIESVVIEEDQAKDKFWETNIEYV